MHYKPTELNNAIIYIINDVKETLTTISLCVLSFRDVKTDGHTGYEY